MKAGSTSLAALALIAASFSLPSNAVAQLKNDGAAPTADTAAIKPPSAQSSFGRIAAGDMAAIDPKKLATMKQLLLMAKQILQQQMQAQLQANLKKAEAATIVPGNGGGPQAPNPNTTTNSTTDPQACESACVQAEVQCQANVLLEAANIGTTTLLDWVVQNNGPFREGPGMTLGKYSGGDGGPSAKWQDLPEGVFHPPYIDAHCSQGAATIAVCGANIENNVTANGDQPVMPGTSQSLDTGGLNSGSGYVNQYGIDQYFGCPDIGGYSYQQWATQLYTLFTQPLQQCNSQWTACAGKC
jgi:hypothetical protein